MSLWLIGMQLMCFKLSLCDPLNNPDNVTRVVPLLDVASVVQ